MQKPTLMCGVQGRCTCDVPCVEKTQEDEKTVEQVCDITQLNEAELE